MLLPALLLAVDLVSGGRAGLRIETDGSPVAVTAAEILRNHVVLMTGVSPAGAGEGPALRIERTDAPGYEIARRGAGTVIRGRDIVRGVYDLLEEWGCRFDGKEPEIPAKESLALPERAWQPVRTLFVEPPAPDPSIPAGGYAVRGLRAFSERRDALVAAHDRLGVRLRVASTSFDDFLAPALHEAHPEWFALRGGTREPRGNFCLSNAEGRAACADTVRAWLDAHPEVESLGLWPEATVVWCECEACAALGPAEAYAALWRDAAERVAPRRIEILASGPTLRPPAGAVPGNVDVRLAPAKDGCGLHGAADEACPGNVAAVVAAWRERGAEPWIEIDAAPSSWLGMPWPCAEAVRADARAFTGAVLRHGDGALARLWRDPDSLPPAPPLPIHSWGDPRDAARLFPDDAAGIPGRIASAERLLTAAADASRAIEARREAAAGALAAYSGALDALPADASRSYERARAGEFRRVVGELLPQGAERAFGPAKLRETIDGVSIETDLLRLDVDRRDARVVGLRRNQADAWSDDLGGGTGIFFAPTSLAGPLDRRDARVRLSLPEVGVLRIEISAATWRSTLDVAAGSPVVRQEVHIEGGGGAAAGCSFPGSAFDHWICPAHAMEGPLPGKDARHAFPLPRGTLIYVRAGERGPGIAARLPRGGYASVQEGASPMLLAASSREALAVEWVVFSTGGELGR